MAETANKTFAQGGWTSNFGKVYTGHCAAAPNTFVRPCWIGTERIQGYKSIANPGGNRALVDMLLMVSRSVGRNTKKNRC